MKHHTERRRYQTIYHHYRLSQHHTNQVLSQHGGKRILSIPGMGSENLQYTSDTYIHHSACHPLNIYVLLYRNLKYVITIGPPCVT